MAKSRRRRQNRPALRRSARTVPQEVRSLANLLGPTFSSSVTSMMRSWLAWEPSLPTILCSLTAAVFPGTGSVPFAAGTGFSRMSDAAYVKEIKLHRFGEDFAVEGYLRDPYGE